MKQSTLARRVAKAIEEHPRRWNRGKLRSNAGGSYCALGHAANIITLSSYLYPGDRWLSDLGDRAKWHSDLTAIDKVNQLREFNEWFGEYAIETDLELENWDRKYQIDIPAFNDHPNTKAKDIVREFKNFSKWLKAQGL